MPPHHLTSRRSRYPLLAYSGESASYNSIRWNSGRLCYNLCKAICFNEFMNSTTTTRHVTAKISKNENLTLITYHSSVIELF